MTPFAQINSLLKVEQIKTNRALHFLECHYGSSRNKKRD